MKPAGVLALAFVACAARHDAGAPAAAVETPAPSRDALLNKAGAEIVSKQPFAIGDLSIAL